MENTNHAGNPVQRIIPDFSRAGIVSVLFHGEQEVKTQEAYIEKLEAFDGNMRKN